MLFGNKELSYQLVLVYDFDINVKYVYNIYPPFYIVVLYMKRDFYLDVYTILSQI